MKIKEKYRPNVAIIIVNKQGKILWCKRKDGKGWQFPQGGIDDGETPEKALYRELEEEVGLLPESVKLLGSTQDWFKYRLPEHMTRKNSNPGFLGQKQKWFLLELIDNDNKVILDGEGEMQKIEISKDILNDEKTIIEDLIVAAHNNAKAKLKNKTSEEISKATGGLGIPGFKWPL